MGFAMVAVAAIVGLVGYVIGIETGRRTTGQPDNHRRSRRYAELCREADSILADLNGPPVDLTGEFNILTTPTRQRVTKWRNTYRKVNP